MFYIVVYINVLFIYEGAYREGIGPINNIYSIIQSYAIWFAHFRGLKNHRQLFTGMHYMKMK